MIVVAEGAKTHGGDVVVDEQRTAHAGREVLGGIGERLAKILRELVDHDVRNITLGHLQRGGQPAAFDRTLGTRMGMSAASALADGESQRWLRFIDNKGDPELSPEELAGCTANDARGKRRYMRSLLEDIERVTADSLLKETRS